jgi:hypothetical protein
MPLLLPLIPNQIYALRPRFEIRVAKDQPFSEISATVFHEIAHVAGMDHSPALSRIEAEARRNAERIGVAGVDCQMDVR